MKATIVNSRNGSSATVQVDGPPFPQMIKFGEHWFARRDEWIILGKLVYVGHVLRDREECEEGV